ncbi:MAG: hypothetical protein LBJ24_07645, partial [Treponema sp.]|nr:hypothetical protein [Treponema sp.]
MALYQRKQPNSLRSLLLGVCTLGLALSLALAGTLCFIRFSSGFGAEINGDGAFYDLLNEYDRALAAGNDGKRLADLLDRLEKKALDVESRLSVLKRRRILTQGGAFRDQYQAALDRAVKAFPFSQPLAALATELIL